MKLFSWLIGVPVAVVCVVFAVSNRGLIGVEFWPLPYVVDLPMFLPVLLMLAVGVLLGGVIAWSAGAPKRARLREQNARVRKLEREVESLRADLDKAEQAAASEKKALPPAAA